MGQQRKRKPIDPRKRKVKKVAHTRELREDQITTKY
jgi:hypothetical protein